MGERMQGGATTWPWRARMSWIAMLALGLASGAACAQPAEINWYFPDLPPHYIVDGPRHGEGFHDQALQGVFMPALPAFHHTMQVAPMLRLLQIMKTDPRACAPSAVPSPERREFMVFSRPTIVMLPPGIFVRRADAKRVAPFLDGAGKLSLTRLLRDGGMTLGVPDGRLYGGKVDALLDQYQNARNVYSLKLQEAERRLVEMTSIGHVDAVLGYSYEAAYHLAASDAVKREPLQFYRLAEQPDYMLSHVACAKGKQGEEVIRAINAALARPATLARLEAQYKAWLDPAALAELQRVEKLNPLKSGDLQ